MLHGLMQLDPFGFSFHFIIHYKHKNKECVDHDNVYPGPLCVSPCHFEVEVALKCSKNGVLCCFCIH